MTEQSCFRWGAYLAAISVMVGALGAHFLKTRIRPDLFYALNVATIMQFFHAISLILFSNFKSNEIFDKLKGILNIMLAGILIFSGSIYLLVIRDLSSIEWLKFFGPITPLGGLLLIYSWIMIALKYNIKK